MVAYLRKGMGAYTCCVIAYTLSYLFIVLLTYNLLCRILMHIFLHCIEVSLYNLNHLIIMDQFSCNLLYRLNKICIFFIVVRGGRCEQVTYVTQNYDHVFTMVSHRRGLFHQSFLKQFDWMIIHPLNYNII